jgi:hypothetical protein
MAKQPTLTVNVNSQQFQQFAKQFNALTGQMKQLNANFAQINSTLNRTNIFLRSAQAGTNLLYSGLTRVAGVAGRITKHFLSWGTIIGAVTALLGVGGSLFGIERLAASIMQKRRMVMGLGGDYGRIQASSIFNQSLIGSPTDVMRNITLGMHGEPDQMKALMAAGVYQPGGKPEDVMDKLVEKLPAMLNKSGPGMVLQMAHAYGIDKLFQDPMDLLRLTTEEGQKEYQVQKELRKQYEKQLEISKPAQRAWSELSLQLQAAGAQLESIFGEKLADLAEPLRHLSDGFAAMVRTLMQSPAVQAIIKELAGWIDKLAIKMKGLTEKDIEKFITKIQNWLPTMEEFKSAMKDFVEILKGAVEVMKFLRHPIEGMLGAGDTAKQRYQEQQGIIKPGQAAKPSIFDWMLGRKPAAPTASSSPNAAPATAPAAMSPGGGGGFPFPGAGGLPGKGASFPAGMPSWLFGGMNQAGIGGTASAWSGAASKMTPQTPFSGRFGNWSGSSDTPEKGGSRPGPLSMNNWQMNRVANLVVRNVPGSNIFMNAEGMVG